MRIGVVTDAWHPQTNGVVTTLENVTRRIATEGHSVEIIEPSRFPTVPLPTYSEIRVVALPWRVAGYLAEQAFDAVHIATEGPLGLAARRFFLRRRIPFTTSLHTKFPEYLRDRTGIPLRVGYRFIRWFHGPAVRTLVTTPSHREELAAWGLEHLVVWSRGVDTERFRPDPVPPANAKPRLLYVGRVAVEKNLEAFLSLDVEGDKVIVGDGPSRAELERAFPDATWLGYRRGEALRAEYARADVFVFPSRTDTFGLVMLEAMACSTPVAAYPATGPVDVVDNGVNGWIDEDLAVAVTRARTVDRASCRRFACTHDWSAISRRLLENLAPIAGEGPSVATA